MTLVLLAIPALLVLVLIIDGFRSLFNEKPGRGLAYLLLAAIVAWASLCLVTAMP